MANHTDRKGNEMKIVRGNTLPDYSLLSIKGEVKGDSDGADAE